MPYLTHAARADLCRRLGKTADARAAYQRALQLARQEPERRFLQGRLRELGENGDVSSPGQNAGQNIKAEPSA